MHIAIHGASGKLGSLIHSFNPSASIITREGIIPDVDIIIDVSSAEGTKALISRLSNTPLLIGTTGTLPWKELEQYAQNAPVAVVPNFSVGIPLLLTLLEQAVRSLPDGWDIEIIEAHHNQKKDAPSGTAKRLAQTIKNAGVEDIPIHALRVGDTFGEHSVWMCGPGERIELKHVATNRSVFAIGALRWAKWLITQPNGLIRS
jgi:4-hydroxy-tetrahydrodipicolinate reductase